MIITIIIKKKKIIIILLLLIIIMIIIIIRDSLISWGEGSSLALVENPSKDGVSIKILVWRHLKPNSQLL